METLPAQAQPQASAIPSFVTLADPVDSDALPDEATLSRQPHPLTPLHQAISKQRELIAAAISAIDDKNYKQARSWLGEVVSSKEPALAQAGFVEQARGYLLILDCLEARQSGQPLTSSLSAAAKRFVQGNRLTPRRDVRRVCLEGRPFARREGR